MHRSVGIKSNQVCSEWERICNDHMATVAAIDRAVDRAVILELDVPVHRYRTDAAQQRDQLERVNRQN